MIQLRPWSADDLDLLMALNTPDMTEHLGGPESDEQIRRRHERYVRLSADDGSRGRMFTIQLDGARVRSIGYWERQWQAIAIYETGWATLPRYQGARHRDRRGARHRWAGSGRRP
jgi:hypothetical protein